MFFLLKNKTKPKSFYRKQNKTQILVIRENNMACSEKNIIVFVLRARNYNV